MFIDQTTIITKTNGVAAAWKSNAPGPAIDIHVTNSIIQANPAIFSSFGTTNVSVGFSLLSTPWDGLEISLANPRFINPASHDYRLSSGSPAIDSGHPAAQSDPDGTRADIGSFTFLAPVATTRLEAGVLFITVQDVSPGRTVVIETSDNLAAWSEVVRSVAKQSPLNVQAQVEESIKFFRFKIE